MADDGHGIKSIARELSLDPKTVRKVLRKRFKTESPSRPSLLDSYRAIIRDKVQTDGLTAVLVMEELKKIGYEGSYTILKEYIRTIRPKPLRRRPHLRFETEPGVQGQVDLSPYTVFFDDVPTDVVCFSFILGYSRWQFIRWLLHADVHAICHGHVLAFDEAGGVPAEILYDQMKQAFIWVKDDEFCLQQFFERMKNHYGFKPIPLEGGYPEGKGKVENPFKYVDGNFLLRHRSRFRNIEDMNEKAAIWLVEYARVREHRTTHERPVDRLDIERPRLKPLPPTRFNAANVVPRLVMPNFHVAWDTNIYSVPPRFTGHQAWVNVLEGNVKVYVDDKLVAEHAEMTTRHEKSTLPEHIAEFHARSTRKVTVASRFNELGRIASAFAVGLHEEQKRAATYHMQKILELADQIGKARINAAMQQAYRYGAFTHSSVANIAKKKLPPETPSETAFDVSIKGTHQQKRGAGHHQRSLDHYRNINPRKDDDGQ